MNVKIYYDPVVDRYEFYVLSGLRDDRALNSEGKWVPHEPGTVPPVYLRMEQPLYEAIMREALNLGMPNRPDELQDCRRVRDRMISLVEKLTDES